MWPLFPRFSDKLKVVLWSYAFMSNSKISVNSSTLREDHHWNSCRCHSPSPILPTQLSREESCIVKVHIFFFFFIIIVKVHIKQPISFHIILHLLPHPFSFIFYELAVTQNAFDELYSRVIYNICKSH